MKKINFNRRAFFLLPYLFLAFLFILLPTILLMIKAFTPVGNGVDNYALLKSFEIWKILWLSILVGLATAFIALFLGVPFAYWTANIKSKTMRFYIMVAIIAPLFIFTLAKILGIKAIFTFVFGDSSFLSSGFFVIIGLTYLNLPFMIIPLYFVFENMPKSLVEASEDLGYNRFWTLFYVIIPYGWKATISGFALVFMLSTTSIAVSQKLLINSMQFPMIANQIMQFTNVENKYDTAMAANLALVTTIIVMAIYFLILFISKFNLIINSFYKQIEKIIIKRKKNNIKGGKNEKNSFNT